MIDTKFVRILHQGDLMDLDLLRVECVRRTVVMTNENPPRPAISGLSVYTIGSFEPYRFDKIEEVSAFLRVWDAHAQAIEPPTQ